MFKRIVAVGTSFIWATASPSFANAQQSPEASGDVFLEQLKLANAGDAAAQSKVGTMYRKGDGVTKSQEEALFWYRKAAVQNDKVGQVNLC